MKRVIQKITFVLLGLAVAAPASLMAQKTEADKEKKEAEQVIINTRGKKKIVVEVDGEKVTVNGKPIDDYDGDEVIVVRNRFKDMATLNNRLFDAYSVQGRAYQAEVNRAMLGVVTEKAEKGAEIQEVTKESGAEKAGLKKGDVITKVNDTKIESPDDLSKAIKKYKAGDKVDVAYIRDKKEQKVSAELTKWKGVTAFSFGDGQQSFGAISPDLDFKRILPGIQSTIPRGSFNYSWPGSSPKMGLSVQDTEDGKGVKVIDVDEESNAAKAGIKEDDIITEVDGKAVNSTDEIAKIIRESKDKISVKIKLTRNGKTENVEVKIPRRLKTTDL